MIYRLCEDRDLPQLFQLWEEQGGWGTIDENTWKSWYTGTPAGDAWVLVAEEESGKIVGQFVFMPSRVLLNGREVKAARPSAPIFARSLRRFPTLVNAMYEAGVQTVRDAGAELIFILPNPKWLRFAERFFGERLLIGSPPLYTLPLAETDEFELPPGFTSRPLTEPDKRVDDLCITASRMHRCATVRNSATLAYRTGWKGVLAVEHGDDLVGLVYSTLKDRQWLICDLLAVDADALTTTLMACCNAARASCLADSQQFSKVGILATPGLQPILSQLGFRADDYQFLFVVQVLGDLISREAVRPELWYLSAND